MGPYTSTKLCATQCIRPQIWMSRRNSIAIQLISKMSHRRLTNNCKYTAIALRSLQIKFEKKKNYKQKRTPCILWIYSICAFVSMVVLDFRILIRKSSHIRMRRMYCETSTFQVCQLSSKWTMIISKYVSVYSLSLNFLFH